MDINAKNIGIRIKEIRFSRGYTQEKLAEKANLHVSYIGMIERGVKNISVKSLNDILTALNFSLVDFFNPFYEISSDMGNNDDLYNSILLPLQSLSKNEREKILEILQLAFALARK